MDRQAYNSCIKPYITGTGIPKEERRRNFCIGAKICSSKAKTKEEAKRLCEEAALVPKIPKISGRGRRRQVAGCNICIGKNIKEVILGASQDLSHNITLQQALKRVPDCPNDYDFEVCV